MTTGRINQVANVCTQDRGIAQGTQSRPAPHNTLPVTAHTQECAFFWLLISQTGCGQQTNTHTSGKQHTKKDTPPSARLGSEKLISKSSFTYCPSTCTCTASQGQNYTSKGVCGKTSESNLTKFTHRTVQTHKAIRSRCRNTHYVPHTPHPGSPGLDSRR